MPNLQNARKALRQSKKRAALNTIRREAYRSAIKSVTKSKTADEAKKLIVMAQKALDKAAQNGVIKRKAAARKLSRLAKRINKGAKK